MNNVEKYHLQEHTRDSRVANSILSGLVRHKFCETKNVVHIKHDENLITQRRSVLAHLFEWPLVT